MSPDVLIIETLLSMMDRLRMPPEPEIYLVHPADKAHLEEHHLDGPPWYPLDCPRCTRIFVFAQRVRARALPMVVS